MYATLYCVFFPDGRIIVHAVIMVLGSREILGHFVFRFLVGSSVYQRFVIHLFACKGLVT
jgi:hypothetical protein